MNLLFISSCCCVDFCAQAWYVSSQNFAWFLKPRGTERSVISKMIRAARTEYKGLLKSLYLTLAHATPNVRRTVFSKVASRLFSLRLLCDVLNAQWSTFQRPPTFDDLFSEVSTIATRLMKWLSSMKTRLEAFVSAFFVNSTAFSITSIPCESTISKDLRMVRRTRFGFASQGCKTSINAPAAHKRAPTNFTRWYMIHVQHFKRYSLS